MVFELVVFGESKWLRSDAPLSNALDHALFRNFSKLTPLHALEWYFSQIDCWHNTVMRLGEKFLHTRNYIWAAVIGCSSISSL